MKGFVFLLLIAISVAAEITHIASCLADGSIGLLFVGLVFPPVGVIHGTGIWFGYF